MLTPRMRTVDNQPLKQHPRDLLLDGLLVGLREEVEQRAREVLRVAVWVAQLVGDAIEEQVSALGVQIHGQVLEDVHVRRVCNGAHVWREALGAQVLNGRRADVHDQRVDQLNVVPVARRLAVGQLQIAAHLGQKGHGRTVLQVAVQVLLEGWLQHGRVVGDRSGRDRDLRKQLDLER